MLRYYYKRYYTLLYIYTAITLLAVLTPCSACTMPTRFSNYGLSDASTVLAAEQDGQGIVWLGTERGLYSFDGYQAYPHYRPHTFSESRVHCLLRSGQRLFLGADDGLLIYDIRHNTYEHVKASPNDIRALRLVGRRLYIGASSGLYVYDCHRVRRVAGISSAVYSLLPDGNTLMVGTLDGLYALRGRISRILLRPGRQPLVNAMIHDRGRQCVWLGTEGALYAYRQGHIVEERALRGNSVKAFSMKVDGTLFIGTDNGLYAYRSTHDVRRFSHDARYPSTLANNIVWTLFRDRWDNLWLGTDNGLSLLAENSFFQWVPISDITHSGDGNRLHAIFQDSEGNYWMGGTDGILRFRAHGDSYSHAAWYRQGDAVYPLSHNRVRKIYQDADSTLWVATDHGINCYNPITGQFRNFIVTDASGNYTTTWAYDIVMDRQRRLWIASYMGGIFVISKPKLLASGGYCVADRHLLLADGLPGIHVGQLAIGRDNHVWGLFYAKGLACVPHGRGRAIPVKSDKSYNYITTDAQGRLWAGYDGGVDIYSSPTQPPRTVSFHDSSADGRVSTICPAGNQMWVITGSVCRIIGLRGDNANYRLPSSDVLAAAFCPREGVVCLAGSDGYYRVDAGRLSGISAREPICLGALYVNGRLYNPSGSNVAYASSVTLSHRENTVAFCLTDIPYAGHPSALYVYQLEGHDKGWTALNAENGRIAYSGLAYGRYRLVVRALDGNGHPADEVYGLDVRILPPWYLTPWAKMVYALLVVVLCCWGWNFWRVRRRLRQEQREKAKILEQVRSKAAFYSQLALRFNHHLRTLMTTANAMLSVGMGKETKSPETRREWDTVRRESGQLATLVYRKLSVDNVQQMSVDKPAAAVDTVAYLRLLTDDGKERARGRKVSVVFTTNTDALIGEVDIIEWHHLFCSILDYLVDESQPQATVSVSVEADMVGQRVSYVLGSTTLPLTPEQRVTLLQSFSPLSEVRKEVERGGGSVAVESEDTALRFLLTFGINRAMAKPTKHLTNTEGDKSADERLLAKVVETIEKNMTDSDFNVSRLQETVGIGSKQLYRKVKLMTGMTPVELIRSLRMRRAASLLKEGQFSVSEVMYMVGFSDSGYFSKCFQKAFGVTPAKYC